ncbi:MAG: hypothetical protein OMM_10272, partial [Candidatus Magnetoglobus multicellularis str. Araruama]
MNWIIPITDEVIISQNEQKNIIEQLIETVNNSSAVALVENVSQALDSATQIIRDTTDDIVALKESFLDPITQLNNSIFNLSNAIQRGINLTLTDTLIDIQSLAGQIQQLLQTPGLVVTSLENQLNAYDNFINGNTELTPEEVSIEGKNQAQTQEISMLSALSGICLATINAEITTRSQAINAIDNITELFDTITNTLDSSQEAFENEDIDKQYFSQSSSYQDCARLVSATLEFLNNKLFELKIEKRFTLEKPRVPLDVTITEYGD